MGCIALVRCVFVLRCGLVSVCRLKQYFSLHTDTTPPQPNCTVTPTHIEPKQYNPWNNSTNKSQAPEMDVLTSETCWALNNEIIKQVTSSWSLFIQLCCTYLHSTQNGHYFSECVSLYVNRTPCGNNQLNWCIWNFFRIIQRNQKMCSKDGGSVRGS